MVMTIPEVIAQLDTFEDELKAMALRLREYRHMLFETLDNESEDC
jgi:RNA processing factor Prp31